MTRSTSRPVGSRISRRRQVRAWRTSSEGGWPWKGTLTTSTRKPRRARLSRSSPTRISAPPVTNGAWTAQTRTVFIHRPPTLLFIDPPSYPPPRRGEGRLLHVRFRLFYTPAVASVIALVDDLMFLSRVREAARSAALEVRTVRTTADLLEAARAGAALLVVDLDSRRLPWAEALASLRADPALATLPVI